MILQYNTIVWDKESAQGSNWVQEGVESESGQIVLKKKWNGPILMHIHDKQCEIMQKISGRVQTSVVSTMGPMGHQETSAKNMENLEN